MSGSYPALMRRLAELAAGLQARRDEAQQWYADRFAAAEAAVAEVEAELATLRRLHAAASKEAEDVDREAAAIWAEASHRFGSAASRFVGPPVPPPGSGVPDHEPEHWLTAARQVLGRTAEAGPLSSSGYPVLALFGVLGAAAAWGLATAGRMAGERYGGDLAVGMPVIALVVTLLGPFVGLGPAKLLADRRHAVLDARTGAIVVAAGLLTTTILLVLLR
ncbi:hypothetical protein O7632_19505 [Solwaraspora sp. WMMD406]|uniref:hypothetical protein n=1 Tax=Solwaraspora sp. WMMD406 TaxID=3016095 RepID=UPI0024167E8C|nr:hypothetical protein [Solwaraspora sp. WMMD406]MDG4766273.1 hypothetical protein [Solwaraspora sp. WMMD406]